MSKAFWSTSGVLRIKRGPSNVVENEVACKKLVCMSTITSGVKNELGIQRFMQENDMHDCYRDAVAEWLHFRFSCRFRFNTHFVDQPMIFGEPDLASTS